MDLIQDSPEWHAWRKSGIGASEIPAVIGVCPYNTAYGVWLVKTGRSKGFDGNSFTAHGKEMEAKARARYELINLEDMPPACASHPKYKMCIASLDGLRADGRLVLEIKCPKGQSTIAAALEGKVIGHYVPQVQYQLAVTGADLLHFFVYHSDTQQDALVEVQSDLEAQGMLIAAAVNFWENHILTDVPPALCDRDVKEVSDPAIAKLCHDLIEKREKMSKKAIDEIKAQVIQLGAHPKIRCGRVQISTVNRSGKFSFHKLTISGEEGA